MNNQTFMPNRPQITRISPSELVYQHPDCTCTFELCDSGFYSLEHAMVLDISNEDNASRRIKHTIKWCEENEANHSYTQLFFHDLKVGSVFGRDFKFIFRSGKSMTLKVSPLSLGPSIFTNTFNEDILQAMNDAILITEAAPFNEPGPRIVFCNQAYLDISGYSVSEIIGQSPRILQGPESQDEAKFNIKQSLEKWRPIKQRLINYRKDGSKFLVELNISPIADDTGWYSHWVSVQRDVTKEQANIEQIRQSKFILETNKIGCWYFNPCDGQCFFDPTMESLHHLSAGAFDTKLDTWMSFIDIDDQDKAKELITTNFGSPDEMQLEYKLKRGENKTRVLRLKSRLVEAPETGNLMIAGVCSDITRQYELQQEIEQHRQLCEESSRLASIGILAAGVGHEVNNPLSVITASTELLEQQLRSSDSTDEEIHSSLSRIHNATCRIETIIDGLRNISVANREKEDQQAINLIDDSADTLHMTKELFARDDIVLRVSLDQDQDNFWLKGTHAGFQQILINLLNNARDAVLDMPQKVISFEVAHDDMNCQFRVIDSGVGIPPDIANKIFDPFVTSKPVGKGTGLGLSITHSIVKSFSGTIKILRSKRGLTIIEVTFPRAHRHSRNNGQVLSSKHFKTETINNLVN